MALFQAREPMFCDLDAKSGRRFDDGRSVVVGSEQLVGTGRRKGRLFFLFAIARYIRVSMLLNSANPGLHLVEVRAFADGI